MATQKIPREKWTEFFDNFSRSHRGWSVTVEGFGSELGAQVEAREMPFEGVTAEVNVRGRDAISVVLGDSPYRHVTHVSDCGYYARTVRRRRSLVS